MLLVLFLVLSLYFSDKINLPLRIGVGVGVMLLVLLLVLGLYFLIKRKMSHTNEDDTELLPTNYRLITFAYNDLQTATDNFANILGEGACGVVFKGTLVDGTVVAVKKLHRAMNGFSAEINMFSELQHDNLLRIVGCCLDEDNKCIVYEYMERKSLHCVLFSEGSNGSELNWQARFNICLGIANGLSYLHEEQPTPMIHRDIKPGNILLDANLNPKIADFGLVRLQAEVAYTHNFAGTVGYAGPEYVMTGELSIKTDIYAFGVVALEIISGRRHFVENLEPRKQSLLNWARTLQQHELLQLVDSRLSGFDEDQVRRVIKVALLCTQEEKMRRPLMSLVIKILLGETDVASVEISSQGAASTSGASTMDDLLPATWECLRKLKNEDQASATV